MEEVIIDSLIDTLKLIPFLLIVFLFMELLEHKFSKKSKNIIKKAGNVGPIYGSLLGVVPQCGFSVAATNLFSARIISIGTLVAVYLSTSDEMLPIMLSEKVPILILAKVIGFKILIGMIVGFIVDFILKKEEKEHVHELCEHSHCSCDESIIKSVLIHTINITFFILVINILFNLILWKIGPDKISDFLLKESFFEPFLTSLVGLIPNCASSIIITELFLKKAISFGAMLSGLLTNSGVALTVLFKENKNIKENIKIIGILYFSGVIFGIILNLIGV